MKQNLTNHSKKLNRSVLFRFICIVTMVMLPIFNLYSQFTNEEIDESVRKQRISGISIEPSPFLQFAFGIEYLSFRGFFITTQMGYSLLLTGENIVITSGVSSAYFQRTADIAYGSGFLFEMNIGYIFKRK
ncbi:MAG: hypothetical protein HY738_20080 [Bacteroidia bacterium]|nr:hypothetical protein [Bacteroidia bacterium]